MNSPDQPTPTTPASIYNRPPRQQLPTLPPEAIDIPPPPPEAAPPSQNWLISVVPVLGIGVMALFYLWRAATAPESGGIFVIPLVVLAFFTIVGTIAAQRWRRREHDKRQVAARRDYIRLLERKRSRLQAAHTAQRALLETTFPHPQTYLNIALERDSRLWERRADDGDFSAVRFGVGYIPSVVQINPPDPDTSSPELEQALRLVNDYRFLSAAPVVTGLQQDASLGVCGRREQVVRLARALVCQLAVTHAPTDLRVHLVTTGDQRDDWRWLAWLPHVAIGRGSTLAFDATATRALLGQLSQQIDARRKDPNAARTPHLLLVVDGVHLVESEAVYVTLLRAGHEVGASILVLVNDYDDLPSDCAAILQIEADGGFVAMQTGGAGGERVGTRVDGLSAREAEQVARALASVTLREIGAAGRIPRRVEFLDLYGAATVDDLVRDLPARWRRDIVDGVLPFPVTIGRESLAVVTTLLLDEDHHGPHGMLAGTTGAGKSELLQTLVCALALEHDPRLLNFLLIDFKGGSTFDVFADLPHTVGMVTNLDGVLVERALAALKAETEERQAFFQQMNVRDITQYHRFYTPTADRFADPTYQPMPHLFIIVDEFAQLAREMPDFLHELVRTAQVGRSLGLHLILGTQSPMDVITDEMNANLQFRICLRVQNIEASRAMLRRPDAAYLPAGWAGRGYLQVGERGVYKQFQTAYAGGDYHQNAAEQSAVLELITENGAVIDLLVDPASDDTLADREPFTTAKALVGLIAGYARRNDIPSSPPLLLPPLAGRMGLDLPFNLIRAGGWDGAGWQSPGRDHHGRPILPGSVLVGLLDDVDNRRQLPLWLHFNLTDGDVTRGGHALVVGAPGSGKTILLMTMAVSAALLHDPAHLHIYLLNFKGGDLHKLADLPGVGAVIGGSARERVRRLFGRLIKTLDARQQGTLPQPIIILGIDQFEQFRDLYFDDHYADLERLVNEGHAAGIYVVLTTATLSAVPERLRALIAQRVALQLSQTGDYLLAVGEVDRSRLLSLPKGRGFLAGRSPVLCQVSLPVLGRSVVDDVVVDAALRELVARMSRAGQVLNRSAVVALPLPVAELPNDLTLDALPLPTESPNLVTTIGRYDDDALTPCELDWDAHGSHFVVTGSVGSGKSNLLHTAVLAAAGEYAPTELRFLLFDFTGRSLSALEPLKHVIACVTNALELDDGLAHLQAEMSALEARWQVGERDLPRTVIIIDDYEIAADVLNLKLDYLNQLRDHVHLHTALGLYIWVAGYLERIGDPLIKQLLRRRVGFAFGGRESLHDLNARAAHLPTIAMPPGRAYFAHRHSIDVVQIAHVDNPALTVRRLNEQIWGDFAPAAWTHDPDSQVAHSAAATDLDIDTDGLIEDLLGGADDV